MAVNFLPSYSYEDYAIWEGDWELIEGIPYAMAPSPMRKHQNLEVLLAQELQEIFEDRADCNLKFKLYEEESVPYYIIIDPKNLCANI